VIVLKKGLFILAVIIILTALTGCGQFRQKMKERAEAKGKSLMENVLGEEGRELAEGVETAGDISELAAKLESASTPEETAAVLEAAAAEEGVNIEILMDARGETIGWRSKDTGALFMAAESLDWPKEMPGTVPVFTAVKPNGITIDERKNIGVMFPETDIKAASAYIKAVKAKGWTESGFYEDESQIVYEGKNGEATLSVLFGEGSFAITYSP
jgi:hypothetical protein